MSGQPDSPESEIVRLLQSLVVIDSADPPGREIDVARTVHEFLTSRGIESELTEFAPGRANVVGRIRGRVAQERGAFAAGFPAVSGPDSGGEAQKSGAMSSDPVVNSTSHACASALVTSGRRVLQFVGNPAW